MEQGNEGDEILLLSLRQIDCNIGAEVVSVSQIQADGLVEIVSKALALITDGDAKVRMIEGREIEGRGRDEDIN